MAKPRIKYENKKMTKIEGKDTIVQVDTNDNRKSTKRV